MMFTKRHLDGIDKNILTLPEDQKGLINESLEYYSKKMYELLALVKSHRLFEMQPVGVGGV